MKYQTNVPFEIPLPLSFEHDFVEVKTSSKTYSLPVFRKSNKKKYVRFSTSDEGEVSFTIGKDILTLIVSKYRGDNTLYSHGPLSVSKEKSIQHSDGTPFFYLADTWWFGATKRMSDKAFTSLLKLRKSQGFSAVHIVVGIPPEVEAFDENAKNQGGFPFDKEWNINPGYFDAFDKRVEEMLNAGIVPVIFGGWGQHIDWLGVDPIKRLWKEIIARYAASPVIFSLAGEVDVFLVPHGIDPKTADTAKTRVKKLLERFPRSVFTLAVKTKRIGSQILYRRQERKLLNKRITNWSEVGMYISDIDAFGRVLTAHPHRQQTASNLFDNPSWLTLNAIQSGHTLETLSFMRKAIKRGQKPIINLEPWYEGITGNFNDYFQRIAFWTCILSGANGHGYGAHGIWQYAKSDNFMSHWGESDAKKAEVFQGALQLGLAKEFLEEKKLFQFVATSTDIRVSYRKTKSFTPIIGKSQSVICIYIPDQRTVKELKLERKISHKLISVISPVNMKKIKVMKLSGNVVSMPIDSSNRDVLLIVE